ncbi:protein of unknown function [Caballeronia sp. S22]
MLIVIFFPESILGWSGPAGERLLEFAKDRRMRPRARCLVSIRLSPMPAAAPVGQTFRRNDGVSRRFV